ncbi:hypothetical protein [Microvirga puerhi]|uniref:hypothetical protein n=1 Tax=Microvirga puerhi TaxID=2876078 RepID=UPI0034E1C33D
MKHHLEVIEGLESRSAHFCCLRELVGTSISQGTFSLQVLEAVAQLERVLERLTKLA